jgi:hypothetical protein
MQLAVQGQLFTRKMPSATSRWASGEQAVNMFFASVKGTGSETSSASPCSWTFDVKKTNNYNSKE